MGRFKDIVKQIVKRDADVDIANIIRSPWPFEAKPNEWGGVNYKYRVPECLHVTSLSKDGGTIKRSRIKFVSKHTNIPAYRVTIKYGREYKGVTCSPKNSILIYDLNFKDLIKANLQEDYIVGRYTPCMDETGRLTYGTIAVVENLKENMDMYDLSLHDEEIFLLDNFLFVYDTVAIHVPIGPEAIEEAKRMTLTAQLIDEPSGSLSAHPEHASSVGIYMLSATPEGREQINKILPKSLQIDKPLSKGDVKDLIKSIHSTDSTGAGKIANELRKIGDMHSFAKGVTTSLSDLEPLKDMRAKTINLIQRDINAIPKEERTTEKLSSIYSKHIKLLEKELAERANNSDDSLSIFIKSKARGSLSQIRDMIIGPIAVISGEMSDRPIMHSYAEGLTPAEYFFSASGARKGVMGRAQATALPGALGKEVLATANNLVINKERGESMNSIKLPTENIDDIMDRYVSEDIMVGDEVIIPKDTVVNTHTLQKIKKHNIKELPVYTPLQSSSADGGIPAYSYGITSSGKTPEVGFNVGASSALGIVAPLFTESMQSFHTGGSMTDRMAGYPRLKQLLELTKEIPHKATLASVEGKVEQLMKDEFGGINVSINGEHHYIKSPLRPTVKVGDTVKPGDQISEGFADPREIAKHKGLLAAQNYMVDEIVKNTPSKVRRRAVEAVVESMTRYAKITDPGDSNYYHGDTVLISEVEKNNKAYANPAKYEYHFKGVNYLPQDTQQWLSQLNFRELNKSFTNAISEGKEQDIHSYQPSSSMALGLDFGKGENGKY